ncbi:hypothetical protein F1880_001662 [Penicillium rolfsii]|nr:hypothetical protein F1880_001662 [Penicillium rolfsii]
MSFQLPEFDELPPIEGMPQGCAWGVFDQDERKDVFGTLNLLTPEVVKEASAEVRRGISISLNWPLGSIKNPNFFRKSLSHSVMELRDAETGAHFGFDDEVEFNTQASSQWDSLCHFLHLPTGMTYNGMRATVEELQNPCTGTQILPTLDKDCLGWHKRGCIVGRGVLIDYKSWADHRGIQYSPFSGHRISPSDIEIVAAHQGTKFQPGDILIIRFGLTEELSKMTAEEQATAMSSHQACGIEGTKEMARWIWNKHFAAVASDNIAVEAMPPILNGKEQPLTQLVLHQWCLSMFGLPLGELWDLKELAKQCRDERRWTFLFTSAPLDVPGAVGSPTNALAIL